MESVCEDPWGGRAEEGRKDIEPDGAGSFPVAEGDETVDSCDTEAEHAGTKVTDDRVSTLVTWGCLLDVEGSLADVGKVELPADDPKVAAVEGEITFES